MFQNIISNRLVPGALRGGESYSRRQALIAGSGVAAAGIVAPTLCWADGAETSPESGWWTWRGPNGNNVAASGSTAPTKYSSDRIAWASPVPGRGHSSPIVTQKHIFLTTADTSKETQSVLAYDRRDGKPLWAQVVHRGGLPQENHRKNTEASPTVAFDGQRVIAAFYNSSAIQLTALSPEGEQLWQTSVGRYDPRAYQYGYAASPAIDRDRVIVAADFDGESFLAAHDCRTGENIWKVSRANATSFSSPIVAQVGGRDQILLSGGNMLAGYDPADGKLLWSSPVTTMATCGTVVWDGDLVFASGGYPKSETACVRGDGSGRVVWTNQQKCYEQSLLAHAGYVYAVTDAGIAHCWRATDGETMWRERLGGLYSSSPVLVGDVIHVFNEQAEGFAFRATPDKYENVGGGKVGDEAFATPSVVGDTMYLRVARNQAARRQEYLVALKE